MIDHIEMEFDVFTNLFLSKNNQYLVALSKKIEVFDYPLMTSVVSLGGVKNPFFARFSSDNKFLAVKSTSGKIGIFNVEKKSLEYEVSSPKQHEGSNFLFSPDDRFIIDGDWNGNIRQIDLFDGSIKILQRNINTMILKIEFDEIQNVFHITKFSRGGIDTLDDPLTSVCRWKYSIEDKMFILDGETRQQAYIGSVSFDDHREKYYSFERALPPSEGMNVIVYNRNLEKIFSKKITNEKCYTNPSDCSVINNGKFLLSYCDNTLRVFSIPLFEMVFEIHTPAPFCPDSCAASFIKNSSTFSLSPDRKIVFWPYFLSGEKKPWRVVVVSTN